MEAGNYMKFVLDDLISKKLKDYLLLQDGINNIEISNNNFLTILNIEHNEKITPEIVLKLIELVQENKYPILYEFDKGTKGNFKTLKYTIDDMCCEYCYRGLIMDLFENEKVKSIKSNFNYYKPAYNIEFIKNL